MQVVSNTPALLEIHESIRYVRTVFILAGGILLVLPTLIILSVLIEGTNPGDDWTFVLFTVAFGSIFTVAGVFQPSRFTLILDAQAGTICVTSWRWPISTKVQTTQLSGGMRAYRRKGFDDSDVCVEFHKGTVILPSFASFAAEEQVVQLINDWRGRFIGR